MKIKITKWECKKERRQDRNGLYTWCCRMRDRINNIASLRINKTSPILSHQCKTHLGARLWGLDSGVFLIVLPE